MLITNTISENEYQLLHDAFTGGGGFEDGSYLFRHKRETDEDYLLRKRMSRYSNFVKVVVNALTNPIFKKTIVRDFDDNKMLTQFRDDVDGKSTPLNKFMKDAAKWARVFGSVFIVEDNYSSEQMVGNKEDALKLRQFPYLYLIFPSQVTDYECDKNGIFTMFKYKVRSKYSMKDARTNISYDEWVWTTTTWEYKNSEAENDHKTGAHNLNKVPVIQLSSTDRDPGAIISVPPMLHIAKANRDLFNRDSEKREILRNQCFPVLTYPVTPQIISQLMKKDEHGNSIGLEIGTNNMLNYPAEASKTPDFIAPPMDPITIIQQEMKDIVDDMFRQAGLTSVVGVQTKQSGVAKQWDFEETNHVLSDLAENCEAAEMEIFNLFSDWTNTPLNDFKLKYPRDFNITDIEDELTKAQQMKDLAVGGQIVSREINRKAAEVYFADIDDKRYQEVINEIETMPDDSSYVKSEE